MALDNLPISSKPKSPPLIVPSSIAVSTASLILDFLATFPAHVSQFPHLQHGPAKATHVRMGVAHSASSCSLRARVLIFLKFPLFQSERSTSRKVRAQSTCQHTSVLS